MTVGNDKAPDDAHRRVQPVQAIKASHRQRGDCEYRGQRVGKDMHVGGTKIVVVHMMVMIVFAVTVMSVVLMMMVGMVVAKHPRANEVY
jgi:hypothetical protein